MFKKKIELYKNIHDDKIFQAIFHIFCLFRDAGAELYLVGGCVRDMLLGKTPKDYDMCTNLTPEEMKALLTKANKEEDYDVEPYSFVDTGLKHGTITVHDRWNGQFFEVTTYRVDGIYEDGRHPNNVAFTTSLEDDLRRRDFTINSFAYNLLTGEVLALDESFFKDLEYEVIRTVGDPEERFNEDALRMLRAIRFAAQLGFTIEHGAYHAIEKCASLLSKISKERIRDELTKILLSDRPDMLKLFVLAGLEPRAFDGWTPLTDMMACDHENPWHYADVFHHTMDVVNAVPKTFELRWAALLHDIGKPATKTLKDGTENYYNYIGHPDVSAEIAEKLMDLLKFSNEQKEIIYKFVKYHDAHLAEVRDSAFKKMVVEIGKEHFLDFIKLRAADSFAHRLLMDTKFAVDFVDKVKARFIEMVKEDQAMTVKDLAIDGYDIIDDGFLRGKEIGDCLRWMLDIVLEHPEYNTREKLLELLQEFKEMAFQAS